MKDQINALFAFGNYYLDQETLGGYVGDAEVLFNDVRTAFWFGRTVQEVIREKTQLELDVIDMMYDRFPESKCLKFIKEYIENYKRMCEELERAREMVDHAKRYFDARHPGVGGVVYHA